MKTVLLRFVSEIAKIHDWILSFNDRFPTVLTDKQLHFWTIGILGMLLFFLIHPIFKALAKRGHIIVVSWFYIFTLIIGMTFAIEIGQLVSHTGSMEFADIVFGVAGFITLFGIFALIRLLVLFIVWLVKRSSEKRESKAKQAEAQRLQAEEEARPMGKHIKQ